MRYGLRVWERCESLVFGTPTLRLAPFNLLSQERRVQVGD